MKKELLCRTSSLVGRFQPPHTPTKQQNRDVTTTTATDSTTASTTTTTTTTSPSSPSRSSSRNNASPPPSPSLATALIRQRNNSISLSPPLRLHVRNKSTLVNMLVSPTLSSRNAASSIGLTNLSTVTGSRSPSVTRSPSISSATSSNDGGVSSPSSTYTSPTMSPYTSKNPASPSASRFSSHTRTHSLPTSPMASRRSWSNRMSMSFQNNASSRRSYSPANCPLFDILSVPEENDYAAFESWEKSLRLYLGSQELQEIIAVPSTDVGKNPIFTDAQCIKAKKAIQTHVCDNLKMDIQQFETPAEIFAYLRRLCLPLEGKALGDTMVKLATTKLSFEGPVEGAGDVAPELHNLMIDDVERVKRFNKLFKGRVWALEQVGSPVSDHASASMYLGAVEKSFEAWRMGMLWMDLSLGLLKLESMMAMFEVGSNIKSWKKKGTAAGLLCWAENMGRDLTTASSFGMLDPIPETTSAGLRV